MARVTVPKSASEDVPSLIIGKGPLLSSDAHCFPPFAILATKKEIYLFKFDEIEFVRRKSHECDTLKNRVLSSTTSSEL